MSKPTILIVEDEILIRHPIAEYLRECGYSVIEAVSPAEARQILESNKKSVEIVLIDIDTDGTSAFALAAWIRANSAPIGAVFDPPIEVILAGSVAKATEKAGDLCKEGPALAKPYDHQLVLDRIRRMLAARQRGKTVE